jgi:hypothetical protein
LGITAISLGSEVVGAVAVADGSVFEHGVSTFSVISGGSAALGDVSFMYEDVSTYQIVS